MTVRDGRVPGLCCRPRRTTASVRSGSCPLLPGGRDLLVWRVPGGRGSATSTLFLSFPTLQSSGPAMRNDNEGIPTRQGLQGKGKGVRSFQRAGPNVQMTRTGIPPATGAWATSSSGLPHLESPIYRASYQRERLAVRVRVRVRVTR